MLAEDSPAGLTREQIQGEVDAQRADSQRLSDERHRRLQEIPGFQQPVALSSLTDAELEEFDAVFAPGGHGPMVDLADNPDAGRLLLALHRKHAPIAALCHGPALLLSAPERADGLWLFDGYRITSFLAEDARRRGRWSRAMADLAVAQRPDNRGVLGKWAGRWSALADEAALGLGTILAATPGSNVSAAEVAAHARTAREDFLAGLGE